MSQLTNAPGPAGPGASERRHLGRRVLDDDLFWHAEAERRAAGYSEGFTGRVLGLVAADLLRGAPPPAGREASTTFRRALHRHLLRLAAEFDLGLDAGALADAAQALAECYGAGLEASFEHRPFVPGGGSRAAACVRACEGIPDEALGPGCLRRLWEASRDAEEGMAREAAELAAGVAHAG